MSEITQKPGPSGAMNINDPLSKNWYRCAIGFKCLQSGLQSFVSNQVGSRHKDLKLKVAENYSDVKPCSVCTSSNLKHDPKCSRRCFCKPSNTDSRRNCPNNFCSYYYRLIVDDHKTKDPSWSSTDISTWYHDCFQYAKCFLSTNSQANCLNGLDCASLLSIVINNRYIRKSIANIKSFEQCRKNRNKLCHSNSLQVIDNDLTDYIDSMISVLKEKCLIQDQRAQTAIHDLNKLKTDQSVVSVEDFEKLKQEAIEEISQVCEEASRNINEHKDAALCQIEQKKLDATVEITEQKNYAIDEIKQTAEMFRNKNEPEKDGTKLKPEKRKHEESDTTSKDIKKQKVDDTEEVSLQCIQKELIDKYVHCFKTLDILPGEDIDFLKIYQNIALYRMSYHREQTMQKDVQIESYKGIFFKGEQKCRNIYITGDAGVGKTSFCSKMCLIWCKAKGVKLENESVVLQENIECMDRFDFVFYISLRDTNKTHVKDMIFQLFPDSNLTNINFIFRHKKCLIILDGFDEWSPATTSKEECIPIIDSLENCVIVTTCRDYKIEHMRLPRRYIDHQVKITGMHNYWHYVEHVINYWNRENNDKKIYYSCKSDLTEFGLTDQLNVPIFACHLIMLWCEQKLTNMPKALIYCHVLEMLFERAKKKKVKFPQSAKSDMKLPESLSECKHLKEHVSLLYKLCRLSFGLLFQPESTFVFTAEDLESSYQLSMEEQICLCAIGVLSKSKEIKLSIKPKLKIAFPHRSYLELFAALYTSTFDADNLFKEKMKMWSSLKKIFPFENFIILLTGFSFPKVSDLFKEFYFSVSNDLTLCRKKAVFHPDKKSYRKQIASFQRMVVKCINEASKSHYSKVKHTDEFEQEMSHTQDTNSPVPHGDINQNLKLEDFSFEKKSDVEILRILLLFNENCIKSIYSETGEFIDGFDQIKTLEYLRIREVKSLDCVKFTKVIENNSKLHSVSVEGDNEQPFFSELPVRGFKHLTSLSLSNVTMQHKCLNDLLEFLSGKILIENIKLYDVACYNHKSSSSDTNCQLTLSLPNHTKLTSVNMSNVEIVCNSVNNSCLQSVILYPASKRIVSSYSDMFKRIKASPLEVLKVKLRLWPDDSLGNYDQETIKTLVTTVGTLSHLQCLILTFVKIPDNVVLQLHTDIRRVDIKFDSVTMSYQCFKTFIESCVNKESVMKLIDCVLTSDDRKTRSQLTREESVNVMGGHLSNLSEVYITHKGSKSLFFQTTICK